MSSLSLSSRASLMVKASFIADAASMPLHWIYNQDKVQELISSEATSAFFKTPSCPFYQYPLGVLSPYGAEGIPVITSVSKVGALDPVLLSSEYFDYFSTYDKDEGKGYTGRLNHVAKMLIEARNAGKTGEDCGADDNQANGIAKVGLITARYAGNSADLSTQIERMVRVLQNNDLSIEASILVGKLLNRILMTGTSSPAQALRDLHEESASSSSSSDLTLFQRQVLAFLHSPERIREWVRFATRLNSQPAPPNDERRNMRVRMKLLTHYLTHEGSLKDTVENNSAYASREDEEYAKSIFDEEPFPARDPTPRSFAAAVGLTCHLPESLICSLFVLQQAKSFTAAIDMNNAMAGDNCSRAMVIGAAFGAAATSEEEVIPREWIEKVQPELWQTIAEATEAIVNANPHFH